MKKNKVMKIGNRRQLMLDDRFFAEVKNVELIVNRPQFAGPVLEPGPEGAWDDGMLDWATVLEDQGLYKMWMNGRAAKILAGCFDSGGDSTLPLGYAVSQDGIHWEKPELGLIEWNGSRKNNIVCMDWGTVFIDPQAEPAERYKLLVSGHHALGCKTVYDDFNPAIGGLYFYTSTDGIRWNWNPQRVLPLFPDSFNQMLYDTRLKKYVAYLRVWEHNFMRDHGYGRAIGRLETDDPLKPWPYKKSKNPFLAWGPKNMACLSTEVTRVMAYPDYDQPGHWTDIYDPEVVQYPWADDAYFAFPALNHFHPDSPIRNHSRLEVGMCVSRDGINWKWPSLEAYIPFGAGGREHNGMIYSMLGMIRRGDEIYQYHCATDIEHIGQLGKIYGYKKLLNSGRIYRTVQRLDGFVSADFGHSGGELLTPILQFSGRELQLNVKAKKDENRVAVCDEKGTPISGFGLKDCRSIAADSVRNIVSWKKRSGLESLAGRPIRLRFQMKNAKLYAFQFA